MKNKRNRMKNVRKNRMRLSLKQVSRAYAGLIVILSIGLTVFFNFNHSKNSFGFATNEFRSVASGNWSSPSTWQKFSGGVWVAATAAPIISDNVITIQSGHTVTIDVATTSDQVVVANGGTLVLNSGITLTLANGSGTDLDVFGIFRNAGTITINTSAIIKVESTGKYQHNFTTVAGTIPAATWSSGSTCEIIGYTSNATGPSGMQAFSNFIWNCPGQTTAINLLGTLNLTGDLTIVATGLGSLALSNVYFYNYTLVGNLNIVGGNFSPNINLFGTSTFLVKGNYTQTGGVFSPGGSNNVTMTVEGNFSLSGGSLPIANASSIIGTLILKGNYSHTGGTLSNSGSPMSMATINFSKSGTQTITTGGNTVTGNVDYIVNSGTTLSLGTGILIGRNFTVINGGSLLISSPAGYDTSSIGSNFRLSGIATTGIVTDFIFSGASVQTLGRSFPGTVRNLTISNPSSVVMDRDVIVTGNLTFTSGKLFTSSFELNITNNATSAIIGASNASYIVGNLRRAVLSTGAYDFPLGSDLLYQPSTLNLSSARGFTSVLGKFNTTNPNDPLNPISIMVSGVWMSEFFDYGSWSFTPNLPMVSGVYTVQLNEAGYSNILGTTSIYSVLYRADSTMPWSSVGTHNDATQSVSGGVATAARSALISFGEYAIAMGDYLSFVSPALISGVAGTIGAVYKFPNVMRGVDAWVYIMDIQGGATLNNIDDATTGYNVSFQPFINYPANSSGYFQWKIQFKKLGTAIDTTARKMTATGVDVDGAGSGPATIREYIEATMPASYSLDAATTLTMTNNSGRYRAIGSAVTIANIDTTQQKAMYELNYNNVSWIEYRTGAINTMATNQIRQTSLFFRSFNLSVRNIALPIELINFDATLKENEVMLNWATATETNNDYFTIERSEDGLNFEKVTTQRGSGNSTSTRSYQAVDPNPISGYSYYRLKQTDFDGHYSYSEVQTVKMKSNVNDNQTIEMKSIAPNPFSDKFAVNFITKSKGKAQVIITNSAGSLVAQEAIEVQDGYNTYEYNDASDFQNGIYFVTIIYNDEKVSKKIMKQ